MVFQNEIWYENIYGMYVYIYIYIQICKHILIFSDSGV